ncbi:MAG: hypothetical protein MR415_08325 [Coriobacteriaceae bacterium]|uniref:hypothetical protein n=1 Tax=Tractidigestivibacter sp. TaxID=2847320 RepID=UPI002A91ED01|nr:hypothetical protein [Tractidigestivibacter sp.]MCI6548635.1 hypothetical protein [Coriobacteriaceae bacterium]MDY5272515.1 hypothetical protein [Tractidigestivibacter sp.]
MATMSDYTTDARIDNGDGIYIFQLDGDRVRWAAAYDGMEGADQAAADFAGITAQGIDPVDSGWEYGGYESLAQAQEDYDTWDMELVASSDYYQGRDADMLAREGPEDWPTRTARRFTESFLGE